MNKFKEKRQAAFSLGHRAEFLASLSLMLKGYRIIERRYRTKLGEIDLIARRGNQVLIVEVKARAQTASAMDAVDVQSMRRIEAADGSRDFAMAMGKVEDAMQAKGASEPQQRKGRFVSVICLAKPDGSAEYYRGEVEGQLVWPPRGELGFGFDPVFLPDGYDKTFGEMTAQEKHGWKPGDKHALSHRARAFQLFARDLLGIE